MEGWSKGRRKTRVVVGWGRWLAWWWMLDINCVNGFNPSECSMESAAGVSWSRNLGSVLFTVQTDLDHGEHKVQKPNCLLLSWCSSFIVRLCFITKSLWNGTEMLFVPPRSVPVFVHTSLHCTLYCANHIQIYCFTFYIDTGRAQSLNTNQATHILRHKPPPSSIVWVWSVGWL